MSINRITALMALLLFMNIQSPAADIFVEAENFADKGGWVTDPQFSDIMGSPYLMAHGMGRPVEDAVTTVDIPKSATYHIYVRTFNWTSPWSKGDGPGRFSLLVGNKAVGGELGSAGESWFWQKAGQAELPKGRTEIRLHDLTGFNGRCDAIFLTTDHEDVPPTEVAALDKFRRKILNMPSKPADEGSYDLVVVGAGIAGMSAAISAARLGCKVALVHDRPVPGGNNSSEVRVHLGGRIEQQPYPALGGLQKEFGPTRFGNANPPEYYEDQKKIDAIAAEKNITFFPSYRAFKVMKKGSAIKGVVAKHIESGREIVVKAPLFADCTGDGTIGYLAGADWAMGREYRAEYNEATAPEKADDMTMGASVQWYSNKDDSPSAFPEFDYGLGVTEENCEKVTMGEWTWETGMFHNQITEFERIRDYGLLVVYSNWSYLKNRYSQKEKYTDRSLGWVAYIAGKRESRRLIGDHVLTQNDLVDYEIYPDATGSTTWSIDLHYPNAKNEANFPQGSFTSIAKHIPIHPYPVPYRCLYSRNVDNLFMAGRNISVTHVALGTTRVMRTTGILGEVVGMATSICRKHDINPRELFPAHFDELKALMGKGVAKPGLENNQKYNEGRTLGPKKQGR